MRNKCVRSGKSDILQKIRTKCCAFCLTLSNAAYIVHHMDYDSAAFDQLCRDLEPEVGSEAWRMNEEVAEKERQKDLRRAQVSIVSA
jgi:hypothetical protein